MVKLELYKISSELLYFLL